MSAQVEELHKAFLKEHSFFEVSWPAELTNHPYFTDEVHSAENQLVLDARRSLARLKHNLTEILSAVDLTPGEPRCQSKLPDISLPKFSGDYSSWPTFSEFFTSLILNNDRLTTVEKLHYLRGCLSGAPAQLISSLPLIGDSLQVSWELLTKRYENKRLIVQSHLDQLFNLQPAQKTASSLNALTSTLSEATKALHSLGIHKDLGDCMIVHHVSRLLDRTTREQWETSLGATQEYPRLQQLETFLTSRARALERIEATSTPTYANSTKVINKKSSTAHYVSEGSQSTGSQPSKSLNSLYPCDCCNGPHFIVTCTQFRDLSPSARLKLAETQRLCYNCLGRHSVRTCKSTLRCKTCSNRHHTMLHSAPPTASSYEPSTSGTQQNKPAH